MRELERDSLCRSGDGKYRTNGEYSRLCRIHKVPVAYFPLPVPSASPLSFLPPPASPSFSSSSSSSFSPASAPPKNITVILSLFATVYCQL